MKTKIQNLVDLEVGNKFMLVNSDVTGVLLTLSDFGCLVYLDNDHAFDSQGNEIRKKTKVRIAAQTQVRIINE